MSFGFKKAPKVNFNSPAPNFLGGDYSRSVKIMHLKLEEGYLLCCNFVFCSSAML